MSLTTNPSDSNLNKVSEDGQMEAYLVLSAEERQKSFVRPVQNVYVHKTCGHPTKIDLLIAESFARDPKMYSQTFCCTCRKHLIVSEFHWQGTDNLVGS